MVIAAAGIARSAGDCETSRNSKNSGTNERSEEMAEGPLRRGEDAAPMLPALAAALGDADLGVRRGQVEVAAPSPRWTEAFDGLVAALAPTRPPEVLGIEHVGSTSVPGLPAKPLLDVVIGQRPGTAPQVLHDWLMTAGSLYRGEADGTRPDRMYALELEPGIRLVNVHVVDHDGAQWRRYLTFRDHLRTQPQAREEYGRLKQRLAGEHPGDRLTYLQAKTAFVTARDGSCAQG